MECRPFKDTSHSLQRTIADVATQLPEVVATDAAVQVFYFLPLFLSP